MGSKNIFVADKITHFPSFCAFALREDDPRAVDWIDFWAVEPCSNAEADYARGLWHVRTTGQRAFIKCVLIFIAIKLRERNRCASGLEQGFTDRIADDFPGVIDIVLMRLLQYRQSKSRLRVL